MEPIQIKGPGLLPVLPPIVLEPDCRQRLQVIGSYRVTKTLGQGTFGKVKEGIHLFTQQKVAIKILEKDKITEVNDIERVAREIHILKIVRHPHIIQMYEIIETSTRLYIIMEHCCNGELFSYITSKTKLKEEEACRLFQQLISAISYLGELGIVHRDVKPENLLLDEQLNLKMVDFGLSNTYKENEKLSTACGSPCYAAPELIKGLEYVGQKADIWSSGVVLYTLLCGHLPFEDSNTQSLYQKILNARYKFTCYLSNEVKMLIKNILVPDPNLRFGLKQILSNQWFVKKFQSQIMQGGTRVGIDFEPLHSLVLTEMQKDLYNPIDTGYIKKCLEANQHNALTSYYYLVTKQLIYQGEDLGGDPTRSLLPAGSQVKKYQSIQPTRSTMDKKVNPLQKQQPGLNDINLGRVQPSVQSPIPPPQPTFNFSPDLVLVQQHTENPHSAFTGLISPTFTDQEQIRNFNSQGRNQKKGPFITMQAHPKPHRSSQLSPQEQKIPVDSRGQIKQKDLLINDYSNDVQPSVFSPNQAMQIQFQNIARANSSQKQKQKFKKTAPHCSLLAATNKGKLLQKINKNNVIFTQQMLNDSFVFNKTEQLSQQDHQSLLERDVKHAIHRSQAMGIQDHQGRKTSSSRSNYLTQTKRQKKQGHKRGNSQMNKYAEMQLYNDGPTAQSARKASAGVLSPVYNSLIATVISKSKLDQKDYSYQDVQKVIRMMPAATTGGSLEQSDTDSQPRRSQKNDYKIQERSFTPALYSSTVQSPTNIIIHTQPLSPQVKQKLSAKPKPKVLNNELKNGKKKLPKRGDSGGKGRMNQTQRAEQVQAELTQNLVFLPATHIRASTSLGGTVGSPLSTLQPGVNQQVRCPSSTRNNELTNFGFKEKGRKQSIPQRQSKQTWAQNIANRHVPQGSQQYSFATTPMAQALGTPMLFSPTYDQSRLIPAMNSDQLKKIFRAANLAI